MFFFGGGEEANEVTKGGLCSQTNQFSDPHFFIPVFSYFTIGYDLFFFIFSFSIPILHSFTSLSFHRFTPSACHIVRGESLLN